MYEEIVKIYEDFINNNLLNIFSSLHGSDNNKLRIKSEFFAESAFFLTVKKKYGLKIVKQEGIDVNKIEVVGITRRSDYPEFTRRSVYELFEFILGMERFDVDKLLEFNKNKELEAKRLIDVLDRSVGRPASFNKPLKEYKTIPAHVYGMMMWNKCEYECFVPGSKGYMFRLSYIDFNNATSNVLKFKEEYYRNKKKYNYIVIPYEAIKIPEYYVIDKKHTLDFVWTNRFDEIVGNYIKSLVIEDKNKNLFFSFD